MAVTQTTNNNNSNKSKTTESGRGAAATVKNPQYRRASAGVCCLVSFVALSFAGTSGDFSCGTFPDA